MNHTRYINTPNHTNRRFIELISSNIQKPKLTRQPSGIYGGKNIPLEVKKPRQKPQKTVKDGETRIYKKKRKSLLNKLENLGI